MRVLTAPDLPNYAAAPAVQASNAPQLPLRQLAHRHRRLTLGAVGLVAVVALANLSLLLLTHGFAVQ